jgi:hypothetical protein
MESAGLIGVVLAVIAGYTYAVLRRSWSDHKKAKAGVRALGEKRWSDLWTAIPVIVLLVLFLRWYVGNL